MSHSVRRHLRVDIDAYDETIRRFIPGYESMLTEAAQAVASVGPGLVLDLGAGTGALSEAILRHEEIRSVELLDVDAEMLEQAKGRLARFGWRARYRLRSFHDPLPSADAVAASLSLHHVPTFEEKRALFRRIHEALWAGGVFVNADATMPADPGEREAMFRFWADHLVASGIAEERAWRHFEEWAEEDTYFPLEDEMAALASVGFEVSCPWREGPIAVVVGQKGDAPPG